MTVPQPPSPQPDPLDNAKPSANPDPPDTTSPPAVEVHGLGFAYPDGPPVLQDVSFRISAGECVGLVGPSGAGKSTLLLHLNGLLPAQIPRRPPAEGARVVRIDGLPVCREHIFEIRRRVGFLFQDPDDQLFCPTVGEDVAFGPLNLGLPDDEVRRRVAESLAQVELAEYAPRSTLQLSVGERKRVCLAGVLACRPTLLALDEPFSSLDPRARRTLSRILSGTPCTRVIATHELDLVVELCSRVLVLDRGQIVADGPTSRILGNAALMDQHGLEVPRTLAVPTPPSVSETRPT